MKIALFGKSPDEAAMPYIQQLITVLEEAGVNIMLYEPFKQIIDPIVKFSSDVQVFNTHEELKQDAQYLLSVGISPIILLMSFKFNARL